MPRQTEVLAGDCTTTYERAGETETRRGAVVVLVKPDNTVLVHDADGYQPAAWLTRADVVRSDRDADGLRLVARSGDERLVVESETAPVAASHGVSPAGSPVGTHPDCGGRLVRDGDRVACVRCTGSWALPRDAAVLDDPCPDCGLPGISVERGATVEVCLDRDCAAIDDAVARSLDGSIDCPDCGTAMVVERQRALQLACPGCERAHRLPAAAFGGECTCGLPTVGGGERGGAEGGGGRCLDEGCERAAVAG